MTTRAARRSPGVGFESRSPRLPEALPRMDVAAFVGFAAQGPIDTPVALEDPAAFADLYGGDPALGWDRERGQTVNGNLGPAVRAFFRNGGRRAFVVRVAGTGAAANHFPVPGLARLTPAGLRPAFLAARAEGSWSDHHDVGAVASIEASAVSAVSFEEGRVSAVRLLAPDTVAPGDLLRLRWADGQTLLAAVETVAGGEATLLAGGALAVLPPPPAAPGPWAAAYFPAPGVDPQTLPALAGDPTFRDDGAATLTFTGDGPPAVGHLLRLARGADRVWLLVTSIDPVDLPGAPPTRGTVVGGRWTRVSTTGPTSLPAGLPSCDRVRIELWVRDGGVHPTRLDGLGAAPGHPRYLGALPTDRRLYAPDEDLLDAGERALLERVRAAQGDGVDLRGYHVDLYQAVATPRFALGADAGQTELYFPLGMGIVPDVYLGPVPMAGEAAVRDGLDAFSAEAFLDRDLGDESVRSLIAQADHLRWQQPVPRRLTGIHAVLGLEEATLVAVPDAVQRGWSTETKVSPAPLDAPAPVATADAAGNWHLDWTAVDPRAVTLVQSSARATFDAPVTVRLDPSVTHYDVPPLGDAPAWLRLRAYVVPPPPGTGDAAYFLDADPEAAGSFWSDPLRLVSPPPAFDDCPAGALAAPALSLAAPPDGNGSYRLTWSAVPGALRYVVEESTALDFLGAAVVFAGPGRDVTIFGRAPGRYHYRVHAEGSAATLSPPVLVGSDGAVFDVTGIDTPRQIVLGAYAGAIGEETVFDGAVFTERFAAGSSRHAIGGGGYRYELLRDDGWPGAPSFRAFDADAAGPPSNGIAVTVSPPARRVLAPVASYEASGRPLLLAIQSALVRLCAARGDLLAVLGLPEHYRAQDAARHVTLLRDAIPEDTAWSHGALYHPWLLGESPERDGAIVHAPPEGATCGVMAARATARGAWIAPANQPLGDVLGLSPAIPREQWQRLYEAQVNLVRPEPHGFVTLGADTLSADPDLRPINVRRLLSLIRRIALREGPAFVFEPNGGVFRRAVAQKFESVMGAMFRAGAFAGDSPTSSFQVDVDTSINSDLNVAEGRFIVELRVAPSQPLSFVTVRLVQTNGLGQVTEGA